MPYDYVVHDAVDLDVNTAVCEGRDRDHSVLAEERAETVAVTVTPPTPTPSALSPSEPTKPASPPRDAGGGLGGAKIAGIALAGAGLVAIGVSVTMSAVARGSYGSAITANACTSDGACPTQTGVDAVNGAKTLADVGTGVFVGGRLRRAKATQPRCGPVHHSESRAPPTPAPRSGRF